MSIHIDAVALADAVEQYAEEVVRATVDEVRDTLLDRAPVHSGDLIASYQEQVDGAHAMLGFTAPQAQYTDEGTRPHFIPANPVLAFNSEKLGRFVVIVNDGKPSVRAFDGRDGALVILGKEGVEHPGNQGTRWFTDVVEAADAAMQYAAQSVTVVV